MTDDAAHPSDDDLILLFYGELPAPASATIERHLERCPTCRAAFSGLAHTLQLAATLRAPDPGPDFEDRLWDGLQPHIPDGRRSTRRLLGVGAWAASVAAIVGATWIWTQAPPDPPERRAANSVAADAGVRTRVLLSAVDAHLAQAEVLFVELLNTPAGAPEAFAHARLTADDLVASGRLYRATAQATGETPVAAMLDDLEAVLVEVARSPDAPRAEDVVALQDRIQADDLLFRVRAVAHDIRNRESRVSAGEGAL